jgi:hypothetical protein
LRVGTLGRGKRQANATHQGFLTACGPIRLGWQDGPYRPRQEQPCQGRPGKALSQCLRDQMGFNGFH